MWSLVSHIISGGNWAVDDVHIDKLLQGCSRRQLYMYYFSKAVRGSVKEKLYWYMALEI
jgi:hypothetical protein